MALVYNFEKEADRKTGMIVQFYLCFYIQTYNSAFRCVKCHYGVGMVKDVTDGVPFYFLAVRCGRREGLGRPDFSLGKPDGRGRPKL